MKRVLLGIFSAATAVGLALLGGPAAAPAAGDGQLQVGAGVADASWHVGASAGQYAGDCPKIDVPDGIPCTPVSHEDGTFDPSLLAVRRLSSYGIQSRLSARAIVIDGPAPGAGDRWAIVKNDNYIPQDLIYRRTAQIVQQEAPGCGIAAQNLTMTSTHDHSSPFYSSTSWGAWTFQDVFDIRFFDYQSHQMAKAIEAACDDLQPAKVGASTNQLDKTHRSSMGPAIADDGTPAGYPRGESDHNLAVVRFDSADGKPIANLVNYSLHGEGVDGNDLISADWVGPLERMMDRETGGVTLYDQRAVGTAEPERSEWHSIHERLEFSHRNYAQGEYAARLIADSAENAWHNIAAGTPSDPDQFIPFDSSPVVKGVDHWYPGPLTHPVPEVSNCRTDSALAGDPLIPLAGLPDCSSLSDVLGTAGLPGTGDLGLPALDPGLSTDDFQTLGIPIPENYGAPAYTGLQEDIDVHLQGLRIGSLYLPICSCEQWQDQARNIVLRTNRTPGDETLPGNLGYDWGAQCTPNGDGSYSADGGTGTWSCPDPKRPGATLPYPISDHDLKRMRAQVNNPANGWNDLLTLLLDPEHNPDSEPVQPSHILGNYTHDDSAENAADGYAMTVPISMANDYNGYIATYREFQRGDHYRKALTGWGPHSSDYMASRLVTMGRQLNDPASPLPQDQRDEQLYAVKVIADLLLNDLRAQALGTTGGAAIDAYTAVLPDDGGDAEVVDQPRDIERFGAALFTWNGGSNFIDDPNVKVQRKVGDDWEDYADQSGEIPVTVKYPQLLAPDAPAYLLGDQHWHWTADFEAFVSGTGTKTFDTGDRPIATPPGTYRFVVDGRRRQGHATNAYHLESREFAVAPWSGITVDDMRVGPGGQVSFAVGPRHTYAVDGTPALEDTIGPIDYPDSYEAPIRFIKDQRTAFRDPADPLNPDEVEWYCFTCSFRPWIDSGDAEHASVLVTKADGETETVAASEAGNRWVMSRPLGGGETAQVLPGAVTDRWGNFNGAASALVSGDTGTGTGTGSGAGSAGGGVADGAHVRTGRRARAMRRCAKAKTRHRRKKCRRRARKLPR